MQVRCFLHDQGVLFMIGGGEIYTLVMQESTHLHLTRIHATLEGDTSFPLIDASRWVLEESVDRAADEQNKFDLTFETWATVQ